MQYDDTKMKVGSLCTDQCWVSVLEAETSVQSEDTKIKIKIKTLCVLISVGSLPLRPRLVCSMRSLR